MFENNVFLQNQSKGIAADAQQVKTRNMRITTTADVIGASATPRRENFNKDVKKFTQKTFR